MATAMPHPAVRGLITEITKDRLMNEAMLAFAERAGDFSTPMAAQLAGIAINPLARAHFNEGLDEVWTMTSSGRIRSEDTNEIVIGGGLHAAIYCSVRVKMGHPKPLVIEGSDRAGGAFAVSNGPAFYLNSRNRPGSLSIPGLDGALNVLPAGPVQPCDLSGDEYQRNNDLAFSIRAALAMNAKVIVGRKVLSITKGEAIRRYAVTLSDGTIIQTNRVIIATGLGQPYLPFALSDRVMSYEQFMKSMDHTFPLRNMDRVAIIGGGDSGRTAVEALIGQGPTSQWSVAGIDYPSKIEWFGARDASFCGDWENNNRSRYKGIGRALPRDYGQQSRLRGMTSRAVTVSTGYETAYVNERPYTHVVVCTGYPAGRDEYISTPISWKAEGDSYFVGGRAVGRRIPEREVYTIGPAAQLPVSDEERSASSSLRAVPENSTSLFRYASRTAALAADLPVPTIGRGVPKSERKIRTKTKSGFRYEGFEYNAGSSYNDGGAFTVSAFAEGPGVSVAPPDRLEEARARLLRGSYSDKAGRTIRAGTRVSVESLGYGTVQGNVVGVASAAENAYYVELDLTTATKNADNGDYRPIISFPSPSLEALPF